METMQALIESGKIHGSPYDRRKSTQRAINDDLMSSLENMINLAERMREILHTRADVDYEIPNGYFNKAYAVLEEAKGKENLNVLPF